MRVHAGVVRRVGADLVRGGIGRPRSTTSDISEAGLPWSRQGDWLKQAQTTWWVESAGEWA